VSDAEGLLDFVLSQPGRNDRAAPNSAARGREGRMVMGREIPGVDSIRSYRTTCAFFWNSGSKSDPGEGD
jgi:hypothetical protein